MKKYNILFLLIISLLANLCLAQEVLTLEESIKLALENNGRVKNSELEIEAARQMKKSAITNYFPSISAGGVMFQSEKPLMEMETEGGDLPVYDGNPDNLPDANQFAYFPGSTMGFLDEGTIGYINIIQPIFAGGRIVNGNKLAALGERVSISLDRLTRDEITLLTKDRYWLIVSLEEKIGTIEKYEEMLGSLSRQVEDAYNSGIVMKNDVLKVKLKQSEILLNKSKLNNGKNLARMAFNQHLGFPLDSTLILENELASIDPPFNLYVESAVALKNRAEYKLLEYSVRAEKLRTKIKWGEYLPQAGIGIAYQYLKLDDAPGRDFGMVFGTVSMPISGWWGGSHELHQRHLKENIAENNLSDNSELLILQIEKSWLDLTDAYTQYLLSEESKEQAEENLKVNDDSYENGLITVSDLLEAQALLRQSEDQLTDAKTNYLLLKTKYLQITGR